MLPEEVRFLPVTAIHRAESFGPAVGSPAAQRHGGQGKFIHTGGRRLPRNLNRRGQKRDRSCFLMFSSFQFFFFFPEFLDCLYVEEKLQINLSTSLIHLVSLTGQPDDGCSSCPFLPGKGFGPKKRPVGLAGHIPGGRIAHLLLDATTVTFSDRVVVSNTLCLIFTPDPWGNDPI